MKKCFVVTPIGNEGTEIRRRADQVFKYIISPVCEEMEFEPIRVDMVNQADSITQTILDYLNSAELVIADMSGHNPNAFYERGYRAAVGKPMIHLKEKSEKIPFDVAGIRAFEYDLSDLDSVAEVKARLAKTIQAFDFSKINQDNENVIDAQVNNDEKSKETDVELLSVLYEIQDQISDLKNEIHNKDTETIQAIVKASVPTAPVEDAQTSLMKALIPELIRNPNSMKNLMEISEMATKKK